MRIVLTILLLLSCFMTNAQKIHLIFFAATNDGSLTTATTNTERHFRNVFAPNLSKYFTVSSYFYTGDRFTKSNVDYAIKNLSVSSDDVVIFYYCGHGYNIEGSGQEFPRLWMGDVDDFNSIWLSDVHSKLKAKNPRLLLTIAEACNRDVRSRANVSNNGDFPPPQTYKINATSIRNLFSASGDYIVSSCSRNQKSSFSNGWGYFTDIFLNMFSQEIRESTANPSWDNIFSRTVAETESFALQNGKTQRPQWKKNEDGPRPIQKVMRPATERFLSKMFEIPKDQNEGIRLKGKYFNMHTSTPNGLFIVKYPDGYPEAKYWFGHIGSDSFYPQILTMAVKTDDQFYVVDMNNISIFRQYDSYGRLVTNRSSSQKNYRFSYIETSNGNCYLGETVNGKYDGFGVFIWANGDSWYGQWSNGVRQGYGILNYYNGATLPKIGYWNNNDYSSQ